MSDGELSIADNPLNFLAEHLQILTEKEKEELEHQYSYKIVFPENDKKNSSKEKICSDYENACKAINIATYVTKNDFVNKINSLFGTNLLFKEGVCVIDDKIHDKILFKENDITIFRNNGVIFPDFKQGFVDKIAGTVTSFSLIAL